MIGRRPGRGAHFGCTALTGLVKPLTQSFEPRGEGGFVGPRSALFAAPACAIGHRPHSRSRGKTELFTALKAARTILTGVWRVKKTAEYDNILKLLEIKLSRRHAAGWSTSSFP